MAACIAGRPGSREDREAGRMDGYLLVARYGIPAGRHTAGRPGRKNPEQRRC
jgi:hypothetical protein